MAEESSPPVPPAEQSTEAEPAREPEPESGELKPEPASDAGFVCECKERLRSACEREPFYKEHESKHYCVLHYPGKEKSAPFKEAIQRKLDDNDFNFRGVWFPDEIDFRGFEFSEPASFRSATFSGAAYFNSATFSADADFSFGTFKATAGFSPAAFDADADFNSVIFGADAGFRSATFSADANFRYAEFSATANFSHAKFNTKTDFRYTKFRAKAYFSAAIFSSEAGFSGATFAADAKYYSATFSADANFDGATFSAVASFSSATFAAADFSSATFGTNASFNSATFSAKADFNSASFSADADFSFATFSADADFSSAAFKAKANFNVAIFNQLGDFTGAFFADALSFYGSASARDLFRSASARDLSHGIRVRPNTLGKNPSLDFQHARFEKPDIVSFHALALHPHWFVNADSRKFAFTDVCWGWNVISIESEIESLTKNENLKVEDSPPHRLLAIACRQLAENAESNNRYEEASSFRYWSMELQRMVYTLEWEAKRTRARTKWMLWRKRSNTSRFLTASRAWIASGERWRKRWVALRFFSMTTLHSTYWVVSGYGERISNAILTLLLIWIFFALLYSWVGFTEQLGFPRAFSYSLAVMSLQKPEPRPLTNWAHTLVTLETILGPVQGALLALAIRRKFMR